MKTNIEHRVCTFNPSGKLIYESNWLTKWQAYKEFCEIADSMEKTLPKGYAVTIVRFSGENIMNQITISGTK